MSRVFRKYLISAFSVVFAVSCSDFLKPKSENEFVPTTVQALNEMLLYEAYANSSSGINPFFDLLSDDAAVVRFSGSESNLLTEVHLSSMRALFSWQPDTYRVFEEDHLSESLYDVYSACYERILGSNAVLDYIDVVEGDEDSRKALKAEALALRGFWYFHLVNTYGMPYSHDKTSMGVPLHLVSHVSSATIARNTVEEVYEQILKDLLEAERLYSSLEEKFWWRTDMRVSLPFVQLLLSRVYLYMEQWQSASDYADKVMKHSQFSLIDKSAFPSDGSHIYFHTYTNPEVIWPYGNSSIFASFIDPYMIDIAKGGKVSFVVAASSLVEMFADGDIRKLHYLVRDKRTTNYKAFGKLALTGGDDSPDSVNKFARSFRLSEAYLNKAEAQAMMYYENGDAGCKEESVRMLEALWAKRIEDGRAVYLDDRSAARLVESVRRERRRELCFEDHRWFDLRRQGMRKMTHEWMGDKTDAQRTIYTLKENDPMWTLQLPESVMLRNDRLIQNPSGPARVD